MDSGPPVGFQGLFGTTYVTADEAEFDLLYVNDAIGDTSRPVPNSYLDTIYVNNIHELTPAHNIVLHHAAHTRELVPTLNSVHDVGQLGLRYRGVFGLDLDGFSLRTDTIADQSLGYVRVDSDLYTRHVAPWIDSTYDLGATGLRYAVLHALTARLSDRLMTNLIQPLSGFDIVAYDANIMPNGIGVHTLGSSLNYWLSSHILGMYTNALHALSGSQISIINADVAPNSVSYTCGTSAQPWGNLYSISGNLTSLAVDTISTNAAVTLNILSPTAIADSFSAVSVGAFLGPELLCSSHFVPQTTSTYNLGSPSLYWDTIYANNLIGPAPSTDAERIRVGSSNTYHLLLGAPANIGNFEIVEGDVNVAMSQLNPTFSNFIVRGAVNVDLLRPYSLGPNTISISGHFLPSTTALYSLGSIPFAFSEIHCNAIYLNYIGSQSGSVQFLKDIHPFTDLSFDIGHASFRWDRTYTRSLFADFLFSNTGFDITTNNDITPDNPGTLAIGSLVNWFNQMVTQNVYTNFIGSRGGPTVAFYDHIVPSSAGVQDIGSGAQYWNQLQCESVRTNTISTRNFVDIVSTNTIKPDLDISRNLGQVTERWLNVHAQTLHATTTRTDVIRTLSGVAIITQNSILPDIDVTHNSGEPGLRWLGVHADTVVANNLALGNALTLPDGTEANPALTFTNELNTGVYRPAPNTFAIGVNGQQRIRASNVDVEIGDTPTEYHLPIVRATEALMTLATNLSGNVYWDFPTAPYGMYSRNSQQTIPVVLGDGVQVGWNVVEYEVGGVVLVGGLNVQVSRPGVYMVSFETNWGPSASGTHRQTWISVNNAIAPGNRRWGRSTKPVAGGTYQIDTSCTFIRLNANDLVGVWCSHDSGVSQILNYEAQLYVSRQMDFQVVWNGKLAP
jgi:hypothetical protein